ncbi:class I SAM-dependent methyltransferase [Saccharothrix texasensis]|uniref:Ubiquinone/menaquinone biosynthesis C-methylase UbiE n=1 Tax=Saccharothrix texasensis TaxID=103734 RepID=A0A3N1GXF0_9PSEU|nr:class I SAM-dependent methyltransferase [Saccharothrix texasensis]ROP34928.1 ubiquinone/menaquinone biosynthesis C-methylase UbiE [Saccharothrix texasensis]
MRFRTSYEGPLGDHFAHRATDSPYNAHTDRPAVLALADDPTGLSVLDVGCGAGHYIAELRARGAAAVFGVEGSETLLGHARARIGDDPAVTLRRHDLEEPLAFLDTGSFDLVVMALVHHHVEARRQLLAEVHRVLRPGGVLLVSTTHPAADWTWHGGSYFDEGRVESSVGDGFTISYRRMTLQTFLNELLDAGFTLERVVEPQATEEARHVDERRYLKTRQTPFFLAVRMRKTR